MSRLLSAFLALGILANLASAQSPLKQRAPNLRRTSSILGALTANRVSCLISPSGEICSDLSPSPRRRVLAPGFTRPVPGALRR